MNLALALLLIRPYSAAPTRFRPSDFVLRISDLAFRVSQTWLPAAQVAHEIADRPERYSC